MIRRVAILTIVIVFTMSIGMAIARDTIDIKGSSTVYPFATVVAEKFGKMGKFKTPKIESTGSGGGLKIFCQGVGVETPDITNASRRIKKSECEKCAKNGVKDIMEVQIGYDGIVVANSKKAKPMKCTRKDLFLALAKNVPDPKNPESGKTVPNPYKKWSDIRKELPNVKIEVLGPPPTSGTRDAFVELAMEKGAKKAFKWIAALKKKDKKAYKILCHTVREDGAWIDAGENDNVIVQKLEVNQKAFGVFGFSFLDQNIDKIQGALVDGAKPTFENISSGEYPLSRPLFFYVKLSHVGKVPGIKEYIAEFTSEKAWGPEGYLAEKGMIPMSEKERKTVKATIAAMKPNVDCSKLK